MLKRKAEVFAPTDGVLSVGIDSTERQARGADFSDADLLTTTYKLCFRRMRVSTRDVELADSTGSEITAKVEVRNAADLTPDLDVAMDGRVYEVTRVEMRGRTCWLWLSQIETDGTCELLPDTYIYDSIGVPQLVDEDPVTVCVRKVATSAKRVTADGADGLAARATLRLRTSDYGGESRVRRLGRTYSVVATETHGRWVDLTCRERGSDRG